MGALRSFAQSCSVLEAEQYIREYTKMCLCFPSTLSHLHPSSYRCCCCCYSYRHTPLPFLTHLHLQLHCFSEVTSAPTEMHGNMLVIHKQNIKWNRSPTFFSAESRDAHRRSELMFGGYVPAGDLRALWHNVRNCRTTLNMTDSTVKFDRFYIFLPTNIPVQPRIKENLWQEELKMSSQQ